MQVVGEVGLGGGGMVQMTTLYKHQPDLYFRLFRQGLGYDIIVSRNTSWYSLKK